MQVNFTVNVGRKFWDFSLCALNRGFTALLHVLIYQDIYSHCFNILIRICLPSILMENSGLEKRSVWLSGQVTFHFLLPNGQVPGKLSFK